MGGFAYRVGDISPYGAVHQLLLIKEIRRPLGMAVFVVSFGVFKQIRERFQKV